MAGGKILGIAVSIFLVYVIREKYPGLSIVSRVVLAEIQEIQKSKSKAHRVGTHLSNVPMEDKACYTC